jgi:hypothetical protein
MPYIGNDLATQFQAFATQTITGDGSTGYTLDRAVANGKEILVYINNVKQEEGSGKSYTASGTTITFSEAVASGDSCYLVYMGSAQQTVTAPDGSIVSGQIANANLEMPNSLDMNGKELILDADGDTSITADTDDQIDIKIAGSDSLRIKANEIENVSGDLTLDVAGNIILDADSTDILLKDGGTTYGQFFKDGNNFKIVAGVQDGDIVFRGNDGGSGVDAAFFDMSDAGTFRTGSQGSANPGSGSNGVIIVNGEGGILITGGSSALRIYSTSSGVPTAQISAAGALAKTSGSFKIDHPLESKKDTHYLVHSFIEGPQADLIYRGKVTLSSGTATVNVDTATGMTEGTFVALNRETQCFTTNETGWTAIKGSISGNILTITAQDNSCTDTISWMVIGERHDPHMKDSGTDWTDSDGKVILEPEKES